MKTIEMQANIMSLNARIDSLEAMFTGYVRVNERRTVSCGLLMEMYQMYLRTLERELAALPAGREQEIRKILAQQIEDADKQYDHYQTWMEMAEEVDRFDEIGISRFEQSQEP